MRMGTIHSTGKKNRIYVYFFYGGERRHEKTPYFCQTGKSGCRCTNCKKALAWIGEVERRIADGIFKYSEYFPESRTLKKLPVADVSENIQFSSYARQWLELKANLAQSTVKSYTDCIESLICFFGKMNIGSIKPSIIQAYIKSLTVSPKTINNRIGVLHSIMKAAVADDIIAKNPCAHVSKPRVTSAEVDPFDLKEAQAIVEWVQKKHPHMAAFFAFAFYTGMRTGEIMGLKWNDIDFRKNKICVRRTITKGIIKESTKTADKRIIDIIPALDQYITAHKQHTFLKSEWLFTTYQNEPFRKIHSVSKSYYEPCLKALGLRYRNIYQTRHSFACIMVDAGENLNWIKSMLGHRTLEMIFKRYGNRINREDGIRKGQIISDIAQNMHKKRKQIDKRL